MTPPPLVECVPNFSDGQDAATLAALEGAIRSTPGARLLDVHADPWHHRSVFTFVSEPDVAAEAVFRAAKIAAERINLAHHRGQHPRMGATDVIPFVPLAAVTMDDCVGLAARLGERIARELEIPVFLYARAARHPDRTVLAHVRGRGVEQLRERIGTTPAATPDFGPLRLHPTAGATAVGARPLMVALNVWLESGDVALARVIARTIRESAGGLAGVQAKGFLVNGRAQVSINLLDLEASPPLRAFEAVRQLAEQAGVAIARGEIVGLAPQRAVPNDAQRVLRLREPAEHKILERHITEAM